MLCVERERDWVLLAGCYAEVGLGCLIAWMEIARRVEWVDGGCGKQSLVEVDVVA